MNKKEISEIRKRFKPENSNIGHVYGCYVNSNKEVISYLDESLSLMPEEEKKQYLDFLKKVLSGAQGRNLSDIVFTSSQVANSDEHRLLMSLREDKPEARQEFFQTVIDNHDSEDNYLILCANDAYDVPYRGHGDVDKSAEKYASEHDDQVFRYFVCAICPVKDGKLTLGYFSGENEFHNCLAKQIVSAPEAGFLFPAFDNRSTNIYNALFYARKPEETHYELIEALFKTELSMTPAEERQAFEDALADAEINSLEAIRGLNERLKAQIDENEEAEPLSIGSGDLVCILSDCGVEDEKLQVFREKYEERFGKAAVNPENIVDLRRFEVKTGDVTITVNPEMSFLVEARDVDGKKYIMIPADGVELNGFAVKV